MTRPTEPTTADRARWDPFAGAPGGSGWVWLVVALLLAYLVGRDALANFVPDADQHNDFFQEWASARFYRAGIPIYSPLDEAIEQHVGIPFAPGARPMVTINAHPPTSVLAALPFGYLAYRPACLVWNLISVLALAVSLGIILHELGLRPGVWSIPPLVAISLLCWPLWNQLHQTQWNLILLLLLTGTWSCWRRGRLGWAGGLLGVAAALKLFPLFLVGVFVIRREWRAVVVTVSALVGLTLVTAATFGISAYRDYGTHVLPSLHRFSGWVNNLSVESAVDRAVRPIDTREGRLPITAGESVEPSRGMQDGGPRVISRPVIHAPALARPLGLLAAAGLVGLLAWQVHRHRGPEHRDRVFALALVTMVLISPIAWDHYVCMLALPFLYAWSSRLWSGPRRMGFASIVLILWQNPLFIASWFLTTEWKGGSMLGMSATPLQTLFLLSLPTFALLGLFALIAWPAARKCP